MKKLLPVETESFFSVNEKNLLSSSRRILFFNTIVKDLLVILKEGDLSKYDYHLVIETIETLHKIKNPSQSKKQSNVLFLSFLLLEKVVEKYPGLKLYQKIFSCNLKIEDDEQVKDVVDTLYSDVEIKELFNTRKELKKEIQSIRGGKTITIILDFDKDNVIKFPLPRKVLTKHKYFKPMFFQDFKEKTASEIHFSDYPASTLRTFFMVLAKFIDSKALKNVDLGLKDADPFVLIEMAGKYCLRSRVTYYLLILALKMIYKRYPTDNLAYYKTVILPKNKIKSTDSKNEILAKINNLADFFGKLEGSEEYLLTESTTEQDYTKCCPWFCHIFPFKDLKYLLEDQGKKNAKKDLILANLLKSLGQHGIPYVLNKMQLPGFANLVGVSKGLSPYNLLLKKYLNYSSDFRTLIHVEMVLDILPLFFQGKQDLKLDRINDVEMKLLMRYLRSYYYFDDKVHSDRCLYFEGCFASLKDERAYMIYGLKICNLMTKGEIITKESQSEKRFYKKVFFEFIKQLKRGNGLYLKEYDFREYPLNLKSISKAFNKVKGIPSLKHITVSFSGLTNRKNLGRKKKYCLPEYLFPKNDTIMGAEELRIIKQGMDKSYINHKHYYEIMNSLDTLLNIVTSPSLKMRIYWKVDGIDLQHP
ncbi:hypothetical protein ACFLZV_05010 [Candidatus Margulisiibacteriota bacterium]